MMCPYKKYQVQGLEVFDGVNLEYLILMTSETPAGIKMSHRDS